MINNISGRRYRIWVNLQTENDTQGLEVTEYCSGESDGFLTLTVERLGEDGIIRTSGQLNLSVPPYNDTFNPRFNTARWAVGNFVYVQVADESGTLREAPINRLRIIKEILPPYYGNWNISIELGCVITLRDSIKPDDTTDQEVDGTQDEDRLSGRTEIFNVMGGRTIAVMNLSSSPGLPVASEATAGEISGFPIQNYKADPDRPIYDQLGELAISSGGGLWQDRNGKIRFVTLVFEPEYRIFKHVIGVDDAADYEPLVAPLRPASEYDVTSDNGNEGGDGNNNNDDDDGGNRGENGCESSTIFLARGVIDGSNNTTLINAIETERCWNWSGSQYTEVTKKQMRGGLIVSSEFRTFLQQTYPSWIFLGPLGMFYAEETTETKTFESSNEGRLLRYVRETYAAPGSILMDYYRKAYGPSTSPPNLYTPILTERTIVEYDYQIRDFGEESNEDAKGQVRKVRSETWKLKGEIAGGANDWQIGDFSGTNLLLFENKTEEWYRRDFETWVHKVETLRAGQVRSGPKSLFLTLQSSTSEGENVVEISRNGNIRPPAAERKREGTANGGQINRGVSYAGKATLLDKDPRVKTADYNYLDSDEHAQRVAAFLLRMDNCRQFGDKITTIFRDEYFYYKPYARVDIEFSPNRIMTTLIDQATFAFGSNQVVVILECMATAEVDTGVVAGP